MESQNLENQFYDDLTKRYGFIIQAGVRFSGKSLFTSALIKEMIESKSFDEYHLFIPTFKFQARGTFDWLSAAKGDITIYEDFSVNIVQRIMSNPKKSKCIWVDDSTSFGNFFAQSDVLKDLVTKCRHYKISLILTCHHLKSVMAPLLRSNVSYYVLHRNVNAKFLEGVWEESASLFMERKEWMSLCRKEMKNDWPCIILDRDRQKYDLQGMSWKSIRKQRLLILNYKEKDIDASATSSRENDKATDTPQRTTDACKAGKCRAKVHTL